MLSGKYNYHKIMFTLEVLGTTDEKFAFINHTRNLIAETIECFESQKPVNLRMYADETIYLEDNCEEFQMFIQEMIKKYSPSIPDRRVPSNEQLKSLIKTEVQEYYKLDSILEYYMQSLEKDTHITSFEQEKEILNKALEKIEPQKSFDVIELEDKSQGTDDPDPKVNITSSIDNELTNFESKNKKEKEVETDHKKKKENITPLNTFPVDIKEKEQQGKDDKITDF